MEQGWGILWEFATEDMSLLQIEEHLVKLFGENYSDAMWRPALNAVMSAECDTELALESVNKLASESRSGQVKQTQTHHPVQNRQLTQSNSQLAELKESITTTLAEFSNCRHISRKIPNKMYNVSKQRRSLICLKKMKLENLYTSLSQTRPLL